MKDDIIIEKYLVTFGLMALVIIVGLIITFFIARWWSSFFMELRYIKIELLRCEGEEKEYWKRRQKICYVSCIPIIGGILAEKMKRKI